MAKVVITVDDKTYIDAEYENIEISKTRTVSPVYRFEDIGPYNLEVQRGSEKTTVIMS